MGRTAQIPLKITAWVVRSTWYVTDKGVQLDVGGAVSEAILGQSGLGLLTLVLLLGLEVVIHTGGLATPDADVGDH